MLIELRTKGAVQEVVASTSELDVTGSHDCVSLRHTAVTQKQPRKLRVASVGHEIWDTKYEICHLQKRSSILIHAHTHENAYQKQ